MEPRENGFIIWESEAGKMKKAKKNKKKIISCVILTIVSVALLFPFLILVTTSFKPTGETYELPVTVFPKEWTLQGYRDAFDQMPFLVYLKNSLFLAVMNVIGTLVSCPLVAYSLSRIEWKGRNTLFVVTLAVMMIPGAVTMVPVYLIWNKFGLIGTYYPLIIGSFLGTPFYIFMLRQFFMGLPKSLEDAARIDGCSEFGIYFRIFLPLMKTALVTISVLQFSTTWNDFMGPLIYLQEESMYTLQIGLQAFKGMHNTTIPAQMAAAFLVTVPMIVLFFFAQKHFTEGITFSGIKG